MGKKFETLTEKGKIQNIHKADWPMWKQMYTFLEKNILTDDFVLESFRELSMKQIDAILKTIPKETNSNQFTLLATRVKNEKILENQLGKLEKQIESLEDRANKSSSLTSDTSALSASKALYEQLNNSYQTYKEDGNTQKLTKGSSETLDTASRDKSINTPRSKFWEILGDKGQQLWDKMKNTTKSQETVNNYKKALQDMKATPEKSMQVAQEPEQSGELPRPPSP